MCYHWVKNFSFSEPGEPIYLSVDLNKNIESRLNACEPDAWAASYRDYAALSYSLLEAQSAKLADIEKRLNGTPRPPRDEQLSLPADEETPRGSLLLPDMEGENFDVRAYWAETRKWDEEGSNAEPSSSDESYAPRRGLEGLGLRRREGYGLRQRPRPTW